MAPYSSSYKILLYLSILLLLISTKIFSQNGFLNSHPDTVRLSRYRLSLGYVVLLQKKNTYEFKHLFFNASYRYSGFRKSLSSSFKIKFAFEPGINGLMIAERNSNNILDFDLFIIPYAKLGPEARVVKNLFMGISVGLIFPFLNERFGAYPFAGVNSYYLLDIGNSFHLEFEAGFHTTFTGGSLPYFLYLTMGISLI